MLYLNPLPSHSFHQRPSHNPNFHLSPNLNLKLGFSLTPGPTLIPPRSPQSRQSLRLLVHKKRASLYQDLPWLQRRLVDTIMVLVFSGRLKFLVLPLAHLFLQQEETPPCVAQGFLLIPLIMLPDHSHNPGQSLPLTVPAHLAQPVGRIIGAMLFLDVSCGPKKNLFSVPLFLATRRPTWWQSLAVMINPWT